MAQLTKYKKAIDLGLITQKELESFGLVPMSNAPTKTLLEEMEITARHTSDDYIAACESYQRSEIKWETWKSMVTKIQ
jgi:hypothetical protein